MLHIEFKIHKTNTVHFLYYFKIVSQRTFHKIMRSSKGRLANIVPYNKKKSTLAVVSAALLTFLFVGCATTPKAVENLKSEVASSASESTPSSSAAESSSDTMTEQSSKSNEKDYYGKWVIQKILAYGSSGTYSSDSAEKLIGQSVNFSSAKATIITDEPSNPLVSITAPKYQVTTESDSDFQTNYQISFDKLGIKENYVTMVNVTGSDKTAGTFLIKSNNTIIFIAGGTYFELERNSDSSGQKAEEPATGSYVKDSGDQKIFEENYGNSKDTTKVLKLTEKELQFDAITVVFSGDFSKMFTKGKGYPYYLDSASGGKRGINIKDNSGVWRTFVYTINS